MNLFLIPIGICEDIERKMNGYLWGRESTGKGVKWMTWAKLCMPKKCEGLGVREPRKVNLAMLAKQGGRFIHQPNGLASRVMKAKYYPQTSFLEAKIGTNSSYVWRSLMEAMDVIKA